MASRHQALEMLARGEVVVGGTVADKASRLVAESESIVIVSPSRFVSRGGEKLDAALERFGLDMAGRRCLDVGASTGGFTDCLLQRGAATVVALDVGYGQLHPRLRADRRVEVRERTNIRLVGAEPGSELGRFDMVSADLSFISLTLVVPVLVEALASAEADLVVLVKPQFEVGRREASRGRGVVSDPQLRRRALGDVASALLGAGATIMGAMASPVLGPAGNAEFLLWARRGSTAGHDAEALARILDDAVADAPDARTGTGTGTGES